MVRWTPSPPAILNNNLKYLNFYKTAKIRPIIRPIIRAKVAFGSISEGQD